VNAGVSAQLHIVSRSFGTRLALDRASFEIQPGEVLGLLGPNGAGKTTTMRLLTGYLRPSAGRVTIGGIDLAVDPVGARRLVGYLPEGSPVPRDLTVRRYLAWRARLLALPRATRRTEVERVCDMAGLDDVAGRRIGQLSRGYRQRVGLAQALIGQPPLLVLDEPTVGLDPRQVATTRNLIARLARQHAVLLSSHLLTEVAQLCRRVVVLDGGRVITTAPVRELTDPTTGGRLRLRLSDPDLGVTVLRGVAGVEAVERRGGDVIVRSAPGGGDLAPAVSAAVVAAGIGLLEMRSESATLEDAYLRLVSE